MSIKNYEKLSAEFTEQNLLVNQLGANETKGKESAEFNAARLKMLDLREQLDESQKQLSIKEK